MHSTSLNRRPGGVTLVAVLAWISGALDIAGGVFLLFMQNDPAVVSSFGGTSGLITSAVVGILLGVIVVAVANGLLRGRNSSRLIITVVEVLSITTGIFLAIAAPTLLSSELVGVLFSVIVLVLLWSRSANAYFIP
ncbi:hypothetical protein [Microterricola pindariensis]|uniref:Major facilitator superfamily (MFS) profile domain-containing protein n=1 Tax=Microterricola pindariensis TaxID=478010 RepID=A0ABX5AYC7_9MICO|nr:hypothetical protein [Microterricola pindariensis]PPL19893.1 hypothetical protein GY24_03840 [Microterricola pindariensis]